MSSLIRVARAVWCEPWLVEPDTHRTLCRILAAHMAEGDAELHRRFVGVALQAAGKIEDKGDSAPYDIVDGVAVVPLQGVIGRKVGALEKSSGVTDVDAFARAVSAAASDPAVSAIMLDIDSPGGTVGGVQSAADTVRTAGDSKPVMAFTGDRMCSAAYWIGSAANAVYAEEMATVGSVGVYTALLDQTRAMEAAGLKMELFASGPYKGAGVAGVPLTDGQRAMIQSRVDELATIFKNDVRRGRAVQDDAMQGQTFLGRGAMAVGMVDAVASFGKAMTDLRAMVALRR
jgi:signal peptide peptidase SppA